MLGFMGAIPFGYRVLDSMIKDLSENPPPPAVVILTGIAASILPVALILLSLAIPAALEGLAMRILGFVYFGVIVFRMPPLYKTAKSEELYIETLRLDPFMNAVCSGDAESLKSLLAEGHDPNIKDSRGRAALYHAVRWNKTAIARLLLEQGADPAAGNNMLFDAEDINTMSSLHWLFFTAITNLLNYL